MRKLIRKIFKYETMTGAGRCPAYLERWTLAKAFGCAVYLHHFIGDDSSIDPHDHPRRFISIGLKGWYFEDIYQKDGRYWLTKCYQAPWVRTFPAEHIHRIRAKLHGNVWTVVIVLPHQRAWGFIKDGKWIPFREYVFGNHYRKSC